MINRYTADATINYIYGLESDAFADDSELHSVLVRTFSPSLKRNVINAVHLTFPFIDHIYQQSFFPRELTEWLYGIMAHAIKIRSTDALNQRQDLLNFLLELGQANAYTDEKIAALAAVFFFDAYETTSTVLVQVLYQLANNIECQDKLRRTVAGMKEITWMELNDLEYLDSVVNGTKYVI